MTKCDESIERCRVLAQSPNKMVASAAQQVQRCNAKGPKLVFNRRYDDLLELSGRFRSL
jgi:hypothetical protein